MAAQSYLRCRHCKGFYEAERPACKWCAYETPILDPAGQPRLFPDRETCRAIQIAEYEQLPPAAHADCFKPPADRLDVLCECLHCGPEGHLFEAVEMRWLVSEQMWACPCTTCGGRGFTFDIHSVSREWHCADCNTYFLPPDGRFTTDNAVCPNCGNRHIDGWFDDEYDEEDFDDDFDPDYNAAIDEDEARDEEIPWDDDDLLSADEDDRPEYDLGITWKESDAEDPLFDSPAESGIPDDIDFPRTREKSDNDLNDDDIPF